MKENALKENLEEEKMDNPKEKIEEKENINEEVQNNKKENDSKNIKERMKAKKEDKDEKQEESKIEKQEEDKKKYPSVAYKLEDELQKKLNLDIRITIPGHTQRGGSPCPYDRVLSTRLGSEAAKLILNDQYGYMVGIVNGKVKKVPLEECAGKLKMVTPDEQLVEDAKRIGISFGD